MFGPLLADLYKSAPQVSTVPDEVVYSSSANLSMERWMEVMRSEGVELKGKVEFRTWNVPFFSTFVNLLARHGELDMYAYVSWCTVQVAALFTNAELILNYYGHSRRAGILHGAFCLSRAYIAASRALLGNYAREVLPAVARPHAEAITLNVEAAFLERLSAWADYDSSVSVMRSWNSTVLSFSMFAPDPKDNISDIIVGEMGDSFVQNWRNAWTSRITYRGFDIKIAITAIETLSFSADIEYRKDFILLPYVFSFPYYDVNAMPSINYGGFGAKVAFAVGQRFHGTYLSEGAGGKSFSTFLSCILNASLTAHFKDAPSLFAEVVSLGAIVDTYRSASDRRRLVHVESLTGEQLLFVAICYAKCIGSYYVVDESMCDAVLQNVPEFSEAFSCARGTPMNPHQQCKLL
ncbi:neprilysin-1 [Rhipicephalus sanguineus]|nr:neprilysin-1 [Rhipicephalus sanguineus]